MLIGADGITALLSSYRLCWIRGRFGGGKTLVAFEFAERFLKRGYRLYSTCPSIWADDWEDMRLDNEGRLHAVIILDEGGLAFKTSKQIEEICAYSRKMDIIVIIPSFIPPAPRARVFAIQPAWSLRGTGIPLVFFQWFVDLGSFKDKGDFQMVLGLGKSALGVYDTLHPGMEPGPLVALLSNHVTEYKKRFGVISDTIQSVGSESDVFSEAVADLSEVVQNFGAIPLLGGKGAGRRR